MQLWAYGNQLCHLPADILTLPLVKSKLMLQTWGCSLSFKLRRLPADILALPLVKSMLMLQHLGMNTMLPSVIRSESLACLQQTHSDRGANTL